MKENELQQIKQRYGIVGNCEALNRAIETALKIAPVDLSALVVGENGVGKEVFPRIIHDNSRRRQKKYFAVNCGAIPEGTIDSELFGHVRGSFTGAVEDRKGYFAAADGGTLFLDEVGELPLSTQARLLRVLETGEYIRVGASQVERTNVRIVAATNVNLEAAIAKGRFREDLYYRLNSVTIKVPPLRERGDDIVLLFRKFALDMKEKYAMPPVRLTPEAERLLLAYAWPGNVRQLRNLAENLSVTAEERNVTPAMLQGALPSPAQNTYVVPSEAHLPAQQHNFEQEREIIYQILIELRRDVDELKRIVHGKALPPPPPQRSEGKEDEPEVPLSVRHSSYFDDAEEITAEVLGKNSEEISFSTAEKKISAAEKNTDSPLDEAQTIEEMEKELIRKTLAECNGRRKVAALKLNISERTLYRKIKDYGLD